MAYSTQNTCKVFAAPTPAHPTVSYTEHTDLYFLDTE